MTEQTLSDAKFTAKSAQIIRPDPLQSFRVDSHPLNSGANLHRLKMDGFFVVDRDGELHLGARLRRRTSPHASKKGS